MHPGKLFMKNDHRFKTAEYGNEISKQGRSSGAKYANGNIPDKKTNDRSAKTEIKNGNDELIIPIHSITIRKLPYKHRKQ